MPAVKAAKINRLGLALLSLAFCSPGQAADTLALVQTLEWHGSPPSGKIDYEQPTELSQEDVWQRIRSGFKIDPAASQNPLVATHESWYASRPAYMKRMV
ncbi:MAG: lytic transglycosylase, partial [Gammaproteobacteria bacterium]